MSGERTRPLAYAERFDAVAATLPGAALPWLTDLRRAAIAGVRRVGLPTTRVEAWKYTNLEKLRQADFGPTVFGLTDTGSLFDTGDLANLGGGHPRLVFVNGRFDKQRSRLDGLPAGVTVMSLAEALTGNHDSLVARLRRFGSVDKDPIGAVNTAFMSDGAIVRVARGVAVNQLFHVLSIGGDQPAAFHLRNLIHLEPGSSMALIERHAGADGSAYWSNPVTDVVLGEGARLAHYRFMEDGSAAYRTAITAVEVAAGATYESFALATGGALARDEIRVALIGEDASCRLDGAYLGQGRQHLDTTTEIVHVKGRTTSRETYKGALAGTARGVFQGRIVVRPEAQKTDGRQVNKTLLLSDGAEIDTKPELEIHADDVKCSHGATAGQLDPDAIFYLRARGIGEDQARRMLTEAFFGDLIESIGDTAMQAAVGKRISAWLVQAGNEDRP